MCKLRDAITHGRQEVIEMLDYLEDAMRRTQRAVETLAVINDTKDFEHELEFYKINSRGVKQMIKEIKSYERNHLQY